MDLQGRFVMMWSMFPMAENSNISDSRESLPCPEMEQIKKENPKQKIIGSFAILFVVRPRSSGICFQPCLITCLFFLVILTELITAGMFLLTSFISGAKHYNELPAYLSHFDCCIIPSICRRRLFMR